MMEIQTKRIYDPADEKDGARVLVDRVWSRGLSRERVQADQWLKDAARARLSENGSAMIDPAVGRARRRHCGHRGATTVGSHPAPKTTGKRFLDIRR